MVSVAREVKAPALADRGFQCDTLTFSNWIQVGIGGLPKPMSYHPRSTKSGFIKCANCGHEVAPNARMCPQCAYPWPLARGKNKMACPTCKKIVSVYYKRKYNRYNVWDRNNTCDYCGAPIRWYDVKVQSADAKKKPKPSPPTIQERLIGAAFVIAIYLVLYLIFG